MGWSWCPENASDLVRNEAAKHEGYLVGFVRDALTSEWRELGRLPDSEQGPPGTGFRYDDPQDVDAVCIACECGWRSVRVAAPAGTEFMPCIVIADDDFEDHACEVWHEHHLDVAVHAALYDAAIPYAGRPFWFTPTSTWMLGKPEHRELRDAVVDALIGLTDGDAPSTCPASINDRQHIGATR